VAALLVGMKNGARRAGPTREWAVFTDPTRKGWEWHLDVTFLLSRWSCIFGRGCKGVDGVPFHGCCSYGVWFRDEDDRKRTERRAAMLTAEEWQNHGRRDGDLFAFGGKESEGRTRTVDGACIFLNKPDFQTGAGCALHHAALRRSEDPADWKPSLCWQLPMNYEEEESNKRHVITSFDHSDWSDDGSEPLHWWCIGAPETATERRRVFQAMAPELRKLMGKNLHATVEGWLEAKARTRTS